MGKHPAKLSPDLEEKLRDRLEDLLDEHDDVDTKRKRIAKALKGQLDAIGGSIQRVRNQLKGEDLDQLSIKGTELPEPAKDPLVQEILKLAGGIVAHEEKEPPKLDWTVNENIHQAAYEGGKYEVEPTPDGARLTWCPEVGKVTRVGDYKSVDDAKAAAPPHALEREADALLKASGDGKLTKKGLKGPATTRKKGGRHG